MKPSGKKVLIGIRVPPTFHRRIQTECVRRDLSLQEMVTAALKVYFHTPVEWDSVDMKFRYDDPKLGKTEATEWNALTDLWERYRRLLPQDKTRVMTNAMEWDLRMRKSSRRKSATRSRQPVGGES